jgi:hypothetical protein
MKKVEGRFELYSLNKGIPQVLAIMRNGNLKNVKSYSDKDQNGTRRISFELGAMDTPWYLVEFHEN